MSIDKLRVSIYSNLPSGGASEIEKSISRYIKSKYKVLYFSDSFLKTKNLIQYLLISLFYLPKLHLKYSNKINRESDVLIAHHTWITKSPIVLRYVNIPTIYICHEPPREFYDSQHIRAQTIKERIINAIRLPIKYVDLINMKSKKITTIVNSYHSKKAIDKYYNINSTVVYPGIDTSIYKVKRFPEKLNQVLSVGSINKLKGFGHLIRVLSKIDESLRPCLVLVGNGGDSTYISYLHKLSDELGVKLKIKINLPRKKLVKEYHRSKLFLYSPINEPFGIVVLEAMASKLPIIAYKYGGGYAEILSEKNGLLIDDLNENTWAESIVKIISDEKLTKKYATFNYQYVNINFTSKIMNKKIIKIITKL